MPTEEQRVAMTQLPQGRRHVMYQEWRELLFLHWEIDPDLIQKTLPPGLFVDTYDGRAYLGVVPFYMCNIRPRYFPGVGPVSNFLEMNVRTYVHDERGIPGVWFYSLDCNQPLAVRVARAFFHLPYFDAKMRALPPSVTHRPFRVSDYSKGPGPEKEITYDCSRKRDSRTRSGTSFRYSGKGNPQPSEPGTLNYFLAERYALFSANRKTGQLYSGQVHHSPYPLEEAELKFFSCEETIEQAGFDTPELLEQPPCSALFSSGVSVRVYPLEKLPTV